MRWKYGHKKETKSVAERQKNPYSIVSSSLLIDKKVFFKNNTSKSNTYGLDILDATSHALKYDVSVTSLSEVPVPAALFLFAPALLGLIGLRRRAKMTAG